MDPNKDGLSIGECSRCHQNITKEKGESIMTLAARHTRLFTGETYRLELLLCDKCTQSFEQWTIFKGG